MAQATSRLAQQEAEVAAGTAALAETVLHHKVGLTWWSFRQLSVLTLIQRFFYVDRVQFKKKFF